MHTCANKLYPPNWWEKEDIMYTLTNEKLEEVTKVAIEKLFPNQCISIDFREDFKNFINTRFSELGCCVLYIPKGSEFSTVFRKFMQKYPKMSCGMRQVIIYTNGALDFRENYATPLSDRAIFAPEFIPKNIQDDSHPWENWKNIPQFHY